MKYLSTALLIFILPLSVFAFSFSRTPAGKLLTIFDEITLAIDAETIAEVWQPESNCRNTATTRVKFRIQSGPNGPFFVGNITEVPISTTITLPRGEYQSIDVAGFDDGGNLCFLSSMENNTGDLLVITAPQCADEIDNDGDGKVDFVEDGSGDSGCDDPRDKDENTPPRIVLNGEGEITATLGDEFLDPGAIAEDDEDDPSPDVITDDSAVDINTMGEYTVRYFARDSTGAEAAEKTRLVRVRPQCFDGKDNDKDGLVDLPNDPECLASFQNNEGSKPVDTGGSGGGGGGGGGGGNGDPSLGQTFNAGGTVLGASINLSTNSGQVLGTTTIVEDEIAGLKAEIERLKAVLIETIKKRISELRAKIDELSAPQS